MRTGGAFQQPGAQRPFQRRNGPADTHFRHLQFAGRRSEAVHLHHTGEDGHLVGNHGMIHSRHQCPVVIGHIVAPCVHQIAPAGCITARCPRALRHCAACHQPKSPPSNRCRRKSRKSRWRSARPCPVRISTARLSHDATGAAVWISAGNIDRAEQGLHAGCPGQLRAGTGPATFEREIGKGRGLVAYAARDPRGALHGALLLDVNLRSLGGRTGERITPAPVCAAAASTGTAPGRREANHRRLHCLPRRPAGNAVRAATGEAAQCRAHAPLRGAAARRHRGLCPCPAGSPAGHARSRRRSGQRRQARPRS